MNLELSPAAERSREILNSFLADLPVYALAALVLGVALLAGMLAARQVRGWVARAGAQYGLQNLLAALARLTVVLLGLALALGIVGINLAPIVAGLGVAGLVVGIALKDALENFIAGVVLLVRRPFTVGDRIVTNGIEGTVTEINLRNTVIRTYGGEEAHVPNGAVLREPVLNKTAYPVARTTVDLRVPYGSDLARAVATLEEAVRAIPEVKSDPPVEVAVLGFEDWGVGLQVRYWTESLGATMNRISILARRRIKEALDGMGIPFAAPGLVIRAPEADGAPQPAAPAAPGAEAAPAAEASPGGQQAGAGRESAESGRHAAG